MVKKALLIGCNYTNVAGATLHGCINDVVNMKANLIANYGYTENDIVVLRDDSTNSAFLPTARNIVGYLVALINISSSCSEIWIHYSGHGSRIRDTHRDEVSGYDSVIVPMDFQTVGVITDDLLYAVVKNSKCLTYMLFDSCNSGTVCDLIWSFEWVRGNQFTRTQNNKLAITNQKIYMISGCKDTQTSADVYNGVTYYGACTDAFLAALKKNKYSAPILQVYKDTCTILAQESFSQKPILSSSSSNPTGAFSKAVLSKSLFLTTGTAAGTAVGTTTPTKAIFGGKLRGKGRMGIMF
jgi:hypothetical protein